MSLLNIVVTLKSCENIKSPTVISVYEHIRQRRKCSDRSERHAIIRLNAIDTVSCPRRAIRFADLSVSNLLTPPPRRCYLNRLFVRMNRSRGEVVAGRSARCLRS
ncbi:hypothetical protein EVAR_14451_1 [Eumeta japonica]|uniref:Uncharacterized protein n=1 Tax=Eumeta variegata TaxID=151549 RepID=A0A4C1U4H4_EUMVA|nr:hypothetical protein EVAR_14451_1 [Eumeta japonica]